MEDNPNIKKTSIEGLILIQRQTFSDERGFFREIARVSEINQAIGASFNVAQMNHARSSQNVLRGIHAAPWNKLIYVVGGSVQVAIVDVRVDSPTFGRFESFIIGDDNKTAIFVSKGLGNSYVVISDEANYFYFTDQEWEAGKEIGVLWNDPLINIPWQVKEPILSEKDKTNKTLEELFPDKF